MRVVEPRDASEEARMSAERQSHELVLRVYARHLLRKHDGNTISLELLAHDSLVPQQVLGGVDPTDPAQYRSLVTIVERKDQLEQRLLPERPALPAPEFLPAGREGP
jgi:hypothetical protein